MRKLTRSPKKNIPTAPTRPKSPLNQKTSYKPIIVQQKVVFRCDTFLLDKIKNALVSQHLAGNYEYPTLSYFFRSALHAYQHGIPLTYQRDLDNPRKEVSFRLTEDLMDFYDSLPMSSKVDILERALGSYFYKILG